MKITVKYGSGNSFETTNFPSGTTIGSVLGNSHVRGALGYGQNVEGNVQGVPMPSDTPIADGMVISVTDKSCTKA